MQIDFSSNPPVVNCYQITIGDSSVTTTTATLTTIGTGKYQHFIGSIAFTSDSDSLGASIVSSSAVDGVTGIIHSLKITDSAFDLSSFSPTGKYYYYIR